MYELVVVAGPDKGLTFALDASTASIGRSRENDIRLRDFTVSRKHLRMTLDEHQCFVEDLKSANGTQIDGQRLSVEEPFSMVPGSLITLGTSTVTLRRADKHSLDPKLREKAYSGQDQRTKDERHVDLINDVTQLIADKPAAIRDTAEAVLQRILTFLVRIDRAMLLLYLPDRSLVRKVAAKSKLDDRDTFPYSRSVVERAVRNRTAVVVFDAAQEDLPDAPNPQGPAIRSVFCLPLYRKVDVLGILYMDSVRRPLGFRKSDVATLEHVCALLSNYLQRLLFRRGNGS